MIFETAGACELSERCEGEFSNDLVENWQDYFS